MPRLCDCHVIERGGVEDLDRRSHRRLRVVRVGAPQPAGGGEAAVQVRGSSPTRGARPTGRSASPLRDVVLGDHGVVDGIEVAGVDGHALVGLRCLRRRAGSAPPGLSALYRTAAGCAAWRATAAIEQHLTRADRSSTIGRTRAEMPNRNVRPVYSYSVIWVVMPPWNSRVGRSLRLMPSTKSFRSRVEIELRAHVPAAEAALVEIERAAVAVVGQEVGVVLVGRRQVEPAALVVDRGARRAVGLLQQRQDQHLVAARHLDAAVDEGQRPGEAETVERRRQEVEAVGKRQLDALDVGGLGVDRRVDVETVVGLAQVSRSSCRSSSARG